MAKRSATDSLDKIRTMVENNPAISVTLQNKIMKCVNSAIKRTKPAVEKAPKAPGTSQFDKKMDISEDMRKFAGWPEGEKHSRVDVTKAIWNYVKTNNLRYEPNKRLFKLDSTLQKLLNTDVTELTFPQIQKYVGDHMIKSSQ